MEGDAEQVDKIASQLKRDIKEGWNIGAWDVEDSRGDNKYQILRLYSITLVKKLGVGKNP